MSTIVIQLCKLLQISASVTTARISDGDLVNLTVNATMESREDLLEIERRAAGPLQRDTISRARNQNAG